MTDEKREERQPKRINPVTIVAGALASLSAAVVASFFGVAGTLVGAAVASVVTSVAAAVYSGLLAATPRWVRRTAPLRDRLASQTRAPSEPEQPLDERSRSPLRLGSWPVPRWLVIGGAAVVIFVLAIGTVTAVEAAIREPIASALGVRDKGQASTSLGVAVRRASGDQGSGQHSQPASSTTTQPGAPPSPGPGQVPGPTSTTGPAPSTGGQAPSTPPPSTSTVQPPASTSSGAPGG